MNTEPRTFVVALMTGVRRVDGRLYRVARGELVPADHPLALHEPTAFAPDGLTQAEFGTAELGYLRTKDRAIPARSPVARAFRKAKAVVWPIGDDSTQRGHEPRNRKARPWTRDGAAEALPPDDPEQA